MHAPIIFYIIIYEGERLTESGGDGEEAAAVKSASAGFARKGAARRMHLKTGSPTPDAFAISA